MTIPFYQKPIPWIIRLVEKALDGASTKADSVDFLSMDSTIHTQYADASWSDRFIRWMAFRPKHLLCSDPSVYNGIRWADLTFVMMTWVIRMYSRVLSWAPTESRESRRKQLHVWSPENMSLPTFSCTVRLLEYFLNNADILDVLHQGETFEVRTEFLDTYTKKSGVGLIGATIRLETVSSLLQPGEQSGD